MLFKLNPQRETLERASSEWDLKELELEKYIITTAGEGTHILSQEVFGEELLLIRNQASTRNRKKADLLSLDQNGNGVIIELKRDEGRLGVETQALQYLAEFSALQGKNFIERFSSRTVNEDLVLSFIGDNAEIKEINKRSRIILVARSFDKTLFSMGEWLSSKGVPFRCIQYTPIEVSGNKFISFNIAFDRTPDPLYLLEFSSTTREPRIFWHNIAYSDQEWWEFLVKNRQLPACFSNSPGDRGEAILTSYIPGDIIIAYASGYGALGWGKISDRAEHWIVGYGDKYDFLNGDCLHRIHINWEATAKKIEDGISSSTIKKEYGIYHPVSTSVSIKYEDGKRLIIKMSELFKTQ